MIGLYAVLLYRLHKLMFLNKTNNNKNNLQ